jgi:hypothetical protein
MSHPHAGSHDAGHGHDHGGAGRGRAARPDRRADLAGGAGGAGGVAAGWDWADPAVGLLITVAILAVLRQAAREIYRRLMDAVDPALVDQAEATLRATPGVLDVGQVRLRWIGHQLRAECEVVVSPDITAVQAHQVTVSAEHDLLHAIPRLSAALVHADPQARGTDPHHVLADHRPAPPPAAVLAPPGRQLHRAGQDRDQQLGDAGGDQPR